MSRRKSKGPPMVRIFACKECGEKSPATKTKGTTASGHVKTFWCFRCQRVTDHIQIDNK